MLRFLDIFFTVFHSALILFNLFGWLFRKTRLANLITLSLTGASWVILGIWFGFGYCPFTDLHWKVLRNMGALNLPDSYIKFLADRIFNADFNAALVDLLTIGLFLFSLFISGVLNYRSFKNRSV